MLRALWFASVDYTIGLKFCTFASSSTISHHGNHTCSRVVHMAACVNAVVQTVQIEAWASEPAV